MSPSCKSERKNKRKRDFSQPVSVWREKELLNEEQVDALVIILATRGCSWSKDNGCTMCGYSNDSNPDMNPEFLHIQLENALAEKENARMAKVYTSGSFFDPEEIPVEVQKELLTMLASAGMEMVLVESRPEYVTCKNLEDLSSIVPLEIAIGLESSNPLVLDKCVNKGFTVKQYKDAAEIIHKAGARLRTYLLLKPPYLTEAAALEDVKRSIAEVSDISHVISINPVNIQRGTVTEQLWKAGQYRPPWLWSLVEALLCQVPPGTRLISSPTGGGSSRGTHNCGKCDRDILQSINKASLSGDVGLLEELLSIPCTCRQVWKDQMDYDLQMRVPTDIGNWRNITWKATSGFR